MTNPSHLPSTGLLGAPRLEASDSGIGPGPLSPIWRREVPDVPPPKNEWAAMIEEFSAIRQTCFASLREGASGWEYLLGLEARADLNAKLKKLRDATLSEISAYHRSSTVAAWPDEVLPTTRLWGARDLADVLGTAIGAASTLSYWAGIGESLKRLEALK